jgi:hypothetical protein
MVGLLARPREAFHKIGGKSDTASPRLELAPGNGQPASSNQLPEVVAMGGKAWGQNTSVGLGEHDGNAPAKWGELVAVMMSR